MLANASHLRTIGGAVREVATGVRGGGTNATNAGSRVEFPWCLTSGFKLCDLTTRNGSDGRKAGE